MECGGWVRGEWGLGEGWRLGEGSVGVEPV